MSIMTTWQSVSYAADVASVNLYLRFIIPRAEAGKRGA